MSENEFLIVTEDEADERLDKILARRFERLYSRTYFQYLIDQQLVLVNGIPVKKRAKLQIDDEIEVQFVATPEIQLEAEPIDLSILYEDEELLIINKPAGMVVHPAPGHWKGTVVNALLYYCQQLPLIDASLRPGIVHRLDKETSGILITAKTLDMQQKMTQLFANRDIYKEYVAICVGKPIEGDMQAPIGRHPIHRKKMAIVPNGKHAISHFKVLGWNDKLSVVKVVISTGRTHQIRVHLQGQEVAILGDSLYGNISSNNFYRIKRQLLHASCIRFKHPHTGEILEIKAPLPEDMQSFCKKLLPKEHELLLIL